MKVTTKATMCVLRSECDSGFPVNPLGDFESPCCGIPSRGGCPGGVRRCPQRPPAALSLPHFTEILAPVRLKLSSVGTYPYKKLLRVVRGYPGGSVVENPPAKQETWARSLVGESPHTWSSEARVSWGAGSATRDASAGRAWHRGSRRAPFTATGEEPTQQQGPRTAK